MTERKFNRTDFETYSALTEEQKNKWFEPADKKRLDELAKLYRYKIIYEAMASSRDLNENKSQHLFLELNKVINNILPTAIHDKTWFMPIARQLKTGQMSKWEFLCRFLDYCGQHNLMRAFHFDIVSVKSTIQNIDKVLKGNVK